MHTPIFRSGLLCLSLLLMATDATGIAAASNPPNGKDIYNQSCAACHGANGKGTIPGVPDFTAKDGVLSNPDKLLIDRAMNGYQGPESPMAMPPKGGNSSLSREDILAVIAYVRRAFGAHPK